MKYLDEKTITSIKRNWHDIIKVIEDTIILLEKKNYSQPIKPYLRYGAKDNRIIAMPAYIGGENKTAGIKWIASFPSNIKKGIKRAHATVILNNADTGEPYCIINTGVISAIRTAAVSGALFKRYIDNTSKTKVNVGIIGFGPIGRTHLDMVMSLGEDKMETIFIYDLNEISLNDIPSNIVKKIKIISSWEEIFDVADVLITCTVSSGRYITKEGRKGTLHLNVSLRDYCPEFMKTVDVMIVDNWEEICRENTDIEFMHLNHNLNKEDVFELSSSKFEVSEVDNKVIMFNPMGMAIFDMAISNYYYEYSKKENIGIDL